MPSRIEYIVLHCTDSEWGNVESIRRFHVSERGWADIGYHYVITNAFESFESVRSRTPMPDSDGVVHKGRDLDRDGDVEEEVGAHVAGWNHFSLGIALVGRRGTFTGSQLRAAFSLCRDLCHRHAVPFYKVIGHYETGAPKTCPDIEMSWFRTRLLDDQ